MRLRDLASTVLALVVPACGHMRSAADSRAECWDEVRRLRSEGAPSEAWFAWTNDLPSPSTWIRAIGGTYCLGSRRFLMTRFDRTCYWGSDWTPADSEFKVELPSASYVWIECDSSIMPIDSFPDAVVPPRAAWVIVVHRGRIGVVSLEDRRGFVVDHPSPETVKSGPLEPSPIEWVDKPAARPVTTPTGN